EKIGAGRMVLTAANVFIGNTRISRGILDLRTSGGGHGSIDASDVLLDVADSTDVNANSAALTGGGSMKSLRVGRGTITPGGPMTVLNDLTFEAPDSLHRDAVLDVQINGTQPGQFGQIVAGNVNLGNQTTLLRVRPIVIVPEGASLDILVNTGNALTLGRFRNLPGKPPDFTLDEFDAVDGQHFLIDYVAGNGNEGRIT